MGSGFMVSVGSMIKSGMAIPAILRMLRRGASPWYVERLSRASYHVNNGRNLGEALHQAGHNFPDVETVQDLRAYASLTGFDDTLDKLGTEWLEEFIEKVQQRDLYYAKCCYGLLGAYIWLDCDGYVLLAPADFIICVRGKAWLTEIKM